MVDFSKAEVGGHAEKTDRFSFTLTAEDTAWTPKGKVSGPAVVSYTVGESGHIEATVTP